MWKDGCNYDGIRTWQWPLHYVDDIHGNRLTYTYFEERKDIKYEDCLHDQKWVYGVDMAVYPESIVYPNNRYRVWFARTSRSDYMQTWTTDSSRTFFQRSLLSEVRIEHDADGQAGNGFEQVVRRYVLTYASANPIFPNLTWSAGGKTATLAQVQEFGLGGSSLPATTFTYSDGMHLTAVDNGYGGSATVTYSDWNELSAPDFDFFEQEFGYWPRPNPCYKTSDTGGWVARNSGDLVYCELKQQTQVGPLKVRGEGKLRLKGEYVRPGGEYQYVVKFKTGTNTNVSMGTTDGDTQHDAYSAAVAVSSASTITMTMPMTPYVNDAYALIKCTPNPCIIDNFKLRLLLNSYRVDEKTLSGGHGENPQSFFYTYDEAASNDAAHSAAVAATTKYTRYFKANSEPRGHAMTRQSGPDGRTTWTWFHQDDGRKGEASVSIVGAESYHHAFETSWDDSGNWSPFGANPTLERLAGDKALKINNPNANWDIGASRTPFILQDGDSLIAQFRIASTASEAILGVASGTWGQSSYYRWGVKLKNAGLYLQRCTGYSGGNCTETDSPSPFLAPVSANTWYVLLLQVDDDDGFRVRVWQRDRPQMSGTANEDLSSLGGGAWRFESKVKSGVLWLDEYSEGQVYTLSETLYDEDCDTPVTPDPDELPERIPGTAYEGLAIYWTRPLAETLYTYEGDGDWVSQQTEFAYDTARQGGVQYGNLTRQVEKAWKGSSYEAYRATAHTYYPNTSGVYLVGLPAAEERYACPLGVCDYEAGDLLAAQRYLYDSNTLYTRRPRRASWPGSARCSIAKAAAAPTRQLALQ